MYEVKLYDNTYMLRLNIVLSLMKTIVMETDDSLASYIQTIYYNRGRNQGVCLFNGTGRSVNIYCSHLNSSINVLFGQIHTVNENDAPGPYEEMGFGEDYLNAAHSVMTYLVYGTTR